jgi:hypothetical protein
VNKNIIILIVMIAALAALFYFYAWPQWKKYHPSGLLEEESVPKVVQLVSGN